MRVALVGPHDHAGRRPSAGQRLAALAAALSGGADVTVYSARPPDVPAQPGYPLVTMSLSTEATLAEGAVVDEDSEVALGLQELARFLYDAWADDRPDVVHADGWIYGVAAQLAADRHRLPIVVAFDGLSSVAATRQLRDVGPPGRRRFERLLGRSATRLVVRCTDEVPEVVRMGCPRERVTVLPLGVDLDTFSTTGVAAGRGGSAAHRGRRR